MCLHDNVMIYLKKAVLSWHDCILFPTILVKSQVIDTIQDEILLFYVYKNKFLFRCQIVVRVDLW